MYTQGTNQGMDDCIQNCQDCHKLCLETVQHCLTMGGEHAEAEHIQTLLDCAEICETSANFMLRSSALRARACGVCAEACEQCARECARFDDAQMKTCADACRRCATTCRQMSTQMAA
jgi:hypothetical protein